MDIERAAHQPAEAYVKIAHSIFELLIVSQFSPRQWRIVCLILRLSRGCGKKTAFIIHQRDFEVAGVSECHIKATIDSLIEAGVVIRQGRYYSINTDFQKWQVSRAPEYEPQKFSQLVCLNLKISDPKESYDTPSIESSAPKLAESESPELLKRKVMAFRNGKYSTPELASAKERLNKYINKDYECRDNLSGNPPETSETFSQEAVDIWTKVLDRLRTQVNAANYSTWLNKTQGLLCSDQMLTIGVPNGFVAKYLDTNLRSLIEKNIIDVTGRGCGVSFRCEGVGESNK